MLFGWRPARLEHLLQELVAHAADGLALGHREVEQAVRMSYVGRDGIAVHVRRPFIFAHVDVAGAHVFLLDVLPGPVDVHAVGGHLGCFSSRRGGFPAGAAVFQAGAAVLAAGRFYSSIGAAAARGVGPSAAEAKGL